MFSVYTTTILFFGDNRFVQNILNELVREGGLVRSNIGVPIGLHYLESCYFIKYFIISSISRRFCVWFRRSLIFYFSQNAFVFLILVCNYRSYNIFCVIVLHLLSAIDLTLLKSNFLFFFIKTVPAIFLFLMIGIWLRLSLCKALYSHSTILSEL